MSQNRLMAGVWRILTSITGVFGLTLLFVNSGTISSLLSYFTTQSNIFLTVLFIWLTIQTVRQLAREGKTGEVYHLKPSFQLAFVFYITITFLVYLIMLSGRVFTMGSGISLAITITHYIVPVMALIDWLVFMPHGRIKFMSAVPWLAYPLAYFAFAMIRAEIGPIFYNGSRYPYFFLDVDVLGWANMVWIFPVFTASFLGLGLGMIALDKLAAKKRLKAGKHST